MGTSFSLRALSFEIKQIIKRIAFTEEQVASLDAEIKEVLEQTKGKWLVTIPGIAETLASAIAGEIGDASLFEDEHKLIAFAGMDPSKFQSGDFDGDKGKMS
ncbi:MAG: transposase, partial [Coriobacteriia bacterium]|nr:transposase [Coriobacteriia bacterium]